MILVKGMIYEIFIMDDIVTTDAKWCKITRHG